MTDPTNDHPRWTVDDDGWLISPSGRTALASWDHDGADDASARNDGTPR